MKVYHIVFHTAFQILIWISIWTLKLTGIFLPVLLFMEYYTVKNRYEKHWCFLWCPLDIDGKWCWLKYVKRNWASYGSPEHGSAGWEYDIATICDKLPKNESLGN